MKRLICILLCFSLFTHLTSSVSFAVTTKQDLNTERSYVESIAVDYITKYIYNSYLYQSNDLTIGTANEILKQSTETYCVDNEFVSASSLCDRMTSFKLSADYYRHIRTAQNIERYDFSYTPTVISSNVETDSAYVHIYTHISFKYLLGSEPSECGDNYIVHLLKIDGNWYIVDIDAEALIAYGLTNLHDTYDEIIEEFDNQQLSTAAVTPAGALTQPRSTGTYDRSYNANNAIAYAYTYTTSSYTGTSGNNTSFLNSNFNDYTNSGGNCQNFVSQCIWAGFGGIDTYSAISNRLFPMNSGWSTVNNSWAAVNPFYTYVTSDTCTLNSIYGVVDGNNGGFSHIPLANLLGAALQVRRSSNTNYHHTLLITGATGYNFSEIQICGNSPMRKAVILADENYASDMRIIMPTAMQNGRTCSGGSHSFVGTHCACQHCGFNKLTVTGAMKKPIAVGTRTTLTATTNSTCYRIALCISYNGQETWTEYMNLSQISKTYTFSNAGLYTITVVARDVTDTDPTSVTATHTYKIRVY